MKQYLLALDEGTTSARAILIDRTGRIVSVAQHEFTQIYPRPGWVEHDAMEIYASQYAAMTECIAGSGVPASEIAAIGVTNQRETTVVWEKATGRPIANAIVWQCRRTADICEKLIADGFAPMIEEKTGLRPDAYFSGTKIAWLLDNVPGAREKAEAGELLFGTVDTWLLWKLTDGRVHVTDRTNASRTMLYNIGTCEWDDELLRLLGVPRSMLPEVRSSSEIYAEISVMGQTIPVSGIAGAVAIVDNSGTANGLLPDYETIDNSPLSIIVLTLANDEQQTPYLQLMGFISRALRADDGYKRLLACTSADEMRKFFRTVQ